MFKRKKPYNYYSYWQALVLSFYSPNIYVDAAKRWAGIGATYLFLVSLIFSAPIAFQCIQKVKDYFPHSLASSLQKMPNLIIHDKKLSFEPNPDTGISSQTSMWIWPKHPSAQHPHPDVLINLKRSVDSFGSVFIPVLITQDFIQIQTFSPWGNKVITDKLTISKENDSAFGAAEISHLFAQTKKNLMSTAYPYVFWLMWSILLSFAAFFAPLINILYYARYRKKLFWQQSVRILCVAITPTLLVLEILYFSHWFTKNWILFAFLICVAYYFFGTRAFLLDQEPVR